MKRLRLKIWTLLITMVFATGMQAQYDDLYYNPDQDYEYEEVYDEQASYEDEYYEDDFESEYFDEYDYYYTSRIRRFHRGYRGFDFFSPAYVDVFYYDPWMSPGVTIYYDTWYQYQNWFRYNRWRRWGPSLSVNIGWGINPWNRPWWNNGWNSWGWNNWNYPGWNNFGFINNNCAWGYSPVAYTGWGNSYYNSFGYYNNNNWIVNNDRRGNVGNRGTYYGPRNNGTVVTSREGRVVGRGGLNGSNGIVESSPRTQASPNTTRIQPKSDRVINKSDERITHVPIDNNRAKQKQNDNNDKIDTRVSKNGSREVTAIAKDDNYSGPARVRKDAMNPRGDVKINNDGLAKSGSKEGDFRPTKQIEKIPRSSTNNDDLRTRIRKSPEVPNTRIADRSADNYRPQRPTYYDPNKRRYERPVRRPNNSVYDRPSTRTRPGSTTPTTRPRSTTPPKTRTSPRYERPKSSTPKTRSSTPSRVPRSSTSPSRSRSSSPKTSPSRSSSRSSGTRSSSSRSSSSRSSGRRG